MGTLPCRSPLNSAISRPCNRHTEAPRCPFSNLLIGSPFVIFGIGASGSQAWRLQCSHLSALSPRTCCQLQKALSGALGGPKADIRAYGPGSCGVGVHMGDCSSHLTCHLPGGLCLPLQFTSPALVAPWHVGHPHQGLSFPSLISPFPGLAPATKPGPSLSLTLFWFFDLGISPSLAWLRDKNLSPSPPCKSPASLQLHHSLSFPPCAFLPWAFAAVSPSTWLAPCSSLFTHLTHTQPQEPLKCYLLQEPSQLTPVCHQGQD